MSGFRAMGWVPNFRPMPYLRLQIIRSGEKIKREQAEVRVGRATDLEMTLAGEASEVVSDGPACVSRWWRVDLFTR